MHTTKMMTREHYAKRFEGLRQTKRDREEAKRWNRFLIDRAEFDELLELELDVYELMMKTMEGRE
jgi:hypothetical protein